MWWVSVPLWALGTLFALRWAILDGLDAIDFDEDQRVQKRKDYDQDSTDHWYALRKYPHRTWDAIDTLITIFVTVAWPFLGLYALILLVVDFFKWTFMKVMFPHGLKSAYAREKERLAAAQELAKRLQAQIDEHEMLAAEHNLPSIKYVLERAEAEAAFLEQAAITAQMAQQTSTPWTGTATRWQ